MPLAENHYIFIASEVRSAYFPSPIWLSSKPEWEFIVWFWMYSAQFIILQQVSRCISFICFVSYRIVSFGWSVCFCDLIWPCGCCCFPLNGIYQCICNGAHHFNVVAFCKSLSLVSSSPQWYWYSVNAIRSAAICMSFDKEAFDAREKQRMRKLGQMEWLMALEGFPRGNRSKSNETFEKYALDKQAMCVELMPRRQTECFKQIFWYFLIECRTESRKRL